MHRPRIMPRQVTLHKLLLPLISIIPTTSSSTMSIAVSAPGKVLLAGGYLVLDKNYSGLVFGLSARIHCISTPDPSASKPGTITVKSPQFSNAIWIYEPERRGVVKQVFQEGYFFPSPLSLPTTPKLTPPALLKTPSSKPPSATSSPTSPPSQTPTHPPALQSPSLPIMTTTPNPSPPPHASTTSPYRSPPRTKPVSAHPQPSSHLSPAVSLQPSPHLPLQHPICAPSRNNN